MWGDEYQNILKLVVLIYGFEKRPKQGDIHKAWHPCIGHRFAME